MTIFVSTHFMNEAERCDRISLMHPGKVLVQRHAGGHLVAERGAATLEEAFIGYLEEAAARGSASRPSPRGGARVALRPRSRRERPDRARASTSDA